MVPRRASAISLGVEGQLGSTLSSGGRSASFSARAGQGGDASQAVSKIHFDIAKA